MGNRTFIYGKNEKLAQHQIRYQAFECATMGEKFKYLFSVNINVTIMEIERTSEADRAIAYLLLLDYTGRLFRDGKAVISAELAGILERLGSSAESWWARIEKLSKGRLLGRFFAASRERLREVAFRLGLHHLPNLGGCPAR